MEDTVYRIFTTLLVLIYLAKKRVALTNGSVTLTPASHIALDERENVADLYIDGVKIEMPQYCVDVYAWLRAKDKELPALYRVLELGKTRMDFLANLMEWV